MAWDWNEAMIYFSLALEQAGAWRSNDHCPVCDMDTVRAIKPKLAPRSKVEMCSVCEYCTVYIPGEYCEFGDWDEIAELIGAVWHRAKWEKATT